MTGNTDIETNATPPVDLWILATDLTETPLDRSAVRRARRRAQRSTAESGEATRREFVRATPARRPWFLLGGVLAALFAAAAGVSVFTLEGAWRAAAAVCTGLLIATASGISSFGIGVRAFRRMSRATVLFTRAMWLLSLVFAFLLGLLGVAAAIVSDAVGAIAPDPAAAAALRAGGRELALILAVLTPMLAIMCSSAAQPLVSISRPRLWQQHWAILCWTASLTMLIATLCLVLLPLAPQWSQWTPSFDAAGLCIGIALALVTAVFAWHIRSREQLAHERRELLVLFDDAARACHDSLDPEPALVRLQEAVATDPFRSQSPAALPTTAGSEIVETVAALLAATRREKQLPAAWEGRTSAPDEAGARFRTARGLVQSDPAAFVAAGAPFLRRCHDELLAGRRKQ
ncbi:MAG: hypothetical protein QM622_05325 [Microbacterium sp.]